MANEIGIQYISGVTLYFTVRRRTDHAIWDTSGTPAFEAYNTASIANYDVALTEQGTASGFYLGTFPAGITTPGIYDVYYFERAGATPAEGDSYLAYREVKWTGTAEVTSSAVIDGISIDRLYKGLLAYIAGKSANTDNGDGTQTIIYYKQDGTTAMLTTTYDTEGEWDTAPTLGT